MSECGPEVMLYVDTQASTQRFYCAQGSHTQHSPLLWGAIANAFQIMKQDRDRTRVRIHRWLTDGYGPKHTHTIVRDGEYLDVLNVDGTVFWASPRTYEVQ